MLVFLKQGFGREILLKIEHTSFKLNHSKLLHTLVYLLYYHH